MGKSRISQLQFKLTQSHPERLAEGSMKVILLKPQTYMNATGPEVKKIADFYKIKPDNMLVAHDDLDIPLGKFKIDHSVGPQLHNGISSIESALGTKEFHRVRIGVDARTKEAPIPGKKYVLERFSVEEERTLHENFPNILALLKLEYKATFPFFAQLAL